MFNNKESVIGVLNDYVNGKLHNEAQVLVCVSYKKEEVSIDFMRLSGKTAEDKIQSLFHDCNKYHLEKPAFIYLPEGKLKSNEEYIKKKANKIDITQSLLNDDLQYSKIFVSNFEIDFADYIKPVLH